MRITANSSGHSYRVSSLGAGPPLLLLHGFTGAGHSWLEHLPGLAHDYRLICPDILGHGYSDSPPQPASYRMPAVAADLIDLLEQLGIGRAHLLGYSMGGRLALMMALHYPRRFDSLLLESASPGLASDSDRQRRRQSDEALADMIEARGIAWFVDHWQRLPLWHSQASLTADRVMAQRRERLAHNPRGLANSLRGMGAGAQPSLWGRLQELRLPTLLLAGQRDDKFLKINRAMAERIPAAQLRIIADAGHNCHLEAPAAFERVLRSFLQGCQGVADEALV